MQIAHAIQQSLFVLSIVYNPKCLVFMFHFLQSLGYLVHISLVLCPIPFVCIGRGNFCLTITDDSRLGGKGVACPGRRQFCNGSDIAGMEFFDLNGFIALHHIELVNLLFHFLLIVINDIIILQYTGADLNQRILTDKGIHDGLKDISRLRFGEVIICLEYLVGL